MAGLLLLCEMTIIKTIAPHLENVLMQNTAQNSQEASFKTSLDLTNRVLCLCPELMNPSHQKAVHRSARGQWNAWLPGDQRGSYLGVEGLSGEKEETETGS